MFRIETQKEETVMLEVSSGAIIYTLVNNELRYVLIKDRYGNYGFPKGHQEEGEEIEDTALREVKEETGLDIKLLPGFKKSIFYTLPSGNNKQVVFFLAYCEDPKPVAQEGEVEKVELLTYRKALETITFNDTKLVFESAHQMVLKRRAEEK